MFRYLINAIFGGEDLLCFGWFIPSGEQVNVKFPQAWSACYEEGMRKKADTAFAVRMALRALVVNLWRRSSGS